MPVRGSTRPSRKSGAGMRWLSVLLLAACVVASVPPAAQEAGPRWFTDIEANYAAAKWGIPETDAVGLVIECDGPSRLIVRPTLYALEEVTPPPSIVLSVDGEEFVRRGEMEFSERVSAWQGIARIVRTDPLIAALRRGSEVTYNFRPEQSPDDRFALSLSGSARAIDAALEAC